MGFAVELYLAYGRVNVDFIVFKCTVKVKLEFTDTAFSIPFAGKVTVGQYKITDTTFDFTFSRDVTTFNV